MAPNHGPRTQASQAAISLQQNIAAESTAVVGFLDFYHAALTAHQAVRGRLAAWPDYIQPFRLMEYLGAFPGQCVDTCTSCITACGSNDKAFVCLPVASDRVWSVQPTAS